MHHVEQRGDEHEGELQWLGHAGEEGGQGAGCHEGADDLAAALIRAQVHGQGGAWQAEHHDWEESGLVASNDAVHGALSVLPDTGALCGGGGRGGRIDGGLAGLEVTDVVDADDIKPEDGVQRVVQARRDEQAVGHTVDARTRGAKALDGGTKVEERVVDEGPYKVEDGGDHDGKKRGEDGNEAAAGEEGQEVRQFGAVKTVIDHRGHDAGEDAEKDVAVTDGIPALGGPFHGVIASKRFGIFDAAVTSDGIGAQQLHEGGIGEEAGQSGGTVGVLGQAKGDSDGEDPAQVIQHGTAGADE